MSSLALAQFLIYASVPDFGIPLKLSKNVSQVYEMFVLRSGNQLELPWASFHLSLCLERKYAGSTHRLNYKAFHINELIRPQ